MSKQSKKENQLRIFRHCLKGNTRKNIIIWCFSSSYTWILELLVGYVCVEIRCLCGKVLGKITQIYSHTEADVAHDSLIWGFHRFQIKQTEISLLGNPSVSQTFIDHHQKRSLTESCRVPAESSHLCVQIVCLCCSFTQCQEDDVWWWRWWDRERQEERNSIVYGSKWSGLLWCWCFESSGWH